MKTIVFEGANYNCTIEQAIAHQRVVGLASYGKIYESDKEALDAFMNSFNCWFEDEN